MCSLRGKTREGSDGERSYALTRDFGVGLPGFEPGTSASEQSLGDFRSSRSHGCN